MQKKERMVYFFTSKTPEIQLFKITAGWYDEGNILQTKILCFMAKRDMKANFFAKQEMLIGDSTPYAE